MGKLALGNTDYFTHNRFQFRVIFCKESLAFFILDKRIFVLVDFIDCGFNLCNLVFASESDAEFTYSPAVTIGLKYGNTVYIS